MISLCAGGRHSMVLAVPDGSSVDRDGDAASSARSSPQLRPLSSNGHGQGADSHCRCTCAGMLYQAALLCSAFSLLDLCCSNMTWHGLC